MKVYVVTFNKDYDDVGAGYVHGVYADEEAAHLKALQLVRESYSGEFIRSTRVVINRDDLAIPTVEQHPYVPGHGCVGDYAAVEEWEV